MFAKTSSSPRDQRKREPSQSLLRIVRLMLSGLMLAGLALVAWGLTSLQSGVQGPQDELPTTVSMRQLPPRGISLNGKWAPHAGATRTKAIEQIELGERVAGRNPIREQVHQGYADPDPSTWREVHLQLVRMDGTTLWMELLRPTEWLEAIDASPGAVVWLDLPEFAARGNATVTFIGPCRPIEVDNGSGHSVVTGKFKHQASANNCVLSIRLEGESNETRVTANHRFWSVDRQEFVQVGEFRIGDVVETEYGTRRIESVGPIAYSGFLYNIETTEHVYRVGTLGTLVHNNCIPGNPFTGPDAPQHAYRHLQKYHGVDPTVASNRLHKIKQQAGLGAADDVAIGRTGDVYNAATGECLGSLTDKTLGQ